MKRERPEQNYDQQYSAYQTYTSSQQPHNNNSLGQPKLIGTDGTRGSSESHPFIPPKIRVPVRVKITLPYLLLALLVAMAGAYIVSRVVLDSVEERFTNQLIE